MFNLEQFFEERKKEADWAKIILFSAISYILFSVQIASEENYLFKLDQFSKLLISRLINIDFSYFYFGLIPYILLLGLLAYKFRKDQSLPTLKQLLYSFLVMILLQILTYSSLRTFENFLLPVYSYLPGFFIRVILLFYISVIFVKVVCFNSKRSSLECIPISIAAIVLAVVLVVFTSNALYSQINDLPRGIFTLANFSKYETKTEPLDPGLNISWDKYGVGDVYDVVRQDNPDGSFALKFIRKLFYRSTGIVEDANCTFTYPKDWVVASKEEFEVFFNDSLSYYHDGVDGTIPGYKLIYKNSSWNTSEREYILFIIGGPWPIYTAKAGSLETVYYDDLRLIERMKRNNSVYGETGFRIFNTSIFRYASVDAQFIDTLYVDKENVSAEHNLEYRRYDAPFGVQFFYYAPKKYQYGKNNDLKYILERIYCEGYANE